MHDLTPLTGLPLVELNCLFLTAYNESAVATMKSLAQMKTYNGLAPADWFARRDQVEQLRKTAPAFPAEKQFERVLALLKEFNPGYDGKVDNHQIERGTSVLLWFGSPSESLIDLSPLKGMKLKNLRVVRCNVADLSPLEGMPLNELFCSYTKVADLAPLQGMPLTALRFASTRVSDLAPLKGMPLASLHLGTIPIADLSPLERMELTEVVLAKTQVSDLSPLIGMPLRWLVCSQTPVEDLSPLKGLPLFKLECSPANALKHAPMLRAMKTLKIVNDVPIGELTDELRGE